MANKKKKPSKRKNKINPWSVEQHFEYYKYGDYIYSKIAHYCGNNKWLLLEKAKLVKLQCIKCDEIEDVEYDTIYNDFSLKYIEPYIITPKENINKIDYCDVIVVSYNKTCTSKSHRIEDIIAILEIINTAGDIQEIEINASYCHNCSRYIILKTDYKNIEGQPTCEVIGSDEQIAENQYKYLYKSHKAAKSHSILTRRGYTVKSISRQTSLQRRTILIGLIQNNILTKAEIISHLDSNIQRGSKIPSWSKATEKWIEDREFISKLTLEDIRTIKIRRLILNAV